MEKDETSMKIDEYYSIIAESLEKISIILTRMTEGNSTAHLLNGTAAAKFIGCSSATITSMRKSGKLRAIRINNRWMYRKTDIIKLIKS